MKAKLKTIIEFYGIKSQIKKLHEELYELTEAILCGDDKSHIEEEFADVQVLLSQIKTYTNLDDKEIKNYFDFKVDRQLKRIEKLGGTNGTDKPI